MSDEGGFTLITLVAVGITWFFANGNIYPESFKFAESVCESHQGLKFLDEDKTSFSEVVIKYDNSKFSKEKK